MVKKNNDYTIANITDYNDRDYTRLRPARIFGRETGDPDNPYSSMKLTALREISDNAVGEVTQGFADTVVITFNPDGSFTVLDNGRGLPVDIGKDAEGRKVSGIYKCMAMAQSGGNLIDAESKKTTSLNGVGAASTLFMSEYGKVTSYRNKKKYSLDFWDGTPGFFKDPNKPSADTFEPLKDFSKLRIEKDDRTKEEKKKFPTGTEVTVKLNNKLFPSEYSYSKDDFRERMKGTASLVKGITIKIVDLEEGKEDKYKYQNGLIDLLELSQSEKPIAEPITLSGNVDYEDGGVDKNTDYEVIFSWTNNFDFYSESYVNTIRTRLGGVHEEAFQRALVKAFNEKFRSMRGLLTKSDSDPIMADYEEGLSVIMSTYVQAPEFSDQTKSELSGTKLRRALEKAMYEELAKYVNAPKNLDEVRTIGKKVTDASKIREQRREKRDLERQKKSLERNNIMPVKLVDCQITHDPLSELVICEGDSALGTIKSSRDSKYQAVFPLKGKPINALKNTMKKIMANDEVKNIVKALDCGVGKDANSDDSRYQIVSIAADADPDGQAICCLVYALFWELFPDFIKKGKLYKITTPLFVVSVGKDKYPALNEEERDDLIKKYGNKITKIKRVKGLGELNKEEMHEYGMSRETRVITQIVLDDVEKAVEMLETTLGNDTGIRKQWIEGNPVEVISE